MLTIVLVLGLVLSLCVNAWLLARLRSAAADRRAMEALLERVRAPGFFWSSTTRRMAPDEILAATRSAPTPRRRE